MQKVNTLFGKRVIDYRSGNAVATVQDVVLNGDHRQIQALLIGDGSRSAGDRVVHWNEISGVGEFVVIDGSQPLRLLNEDPEMLELRAAAVQITGKKVISADGEHIGTVADLYYTPDGRLAAFEMKQGIFGSGPSLLRAEYVQAIGRDALISSSSELLTHDQFSGETRLASDTHDEPIVDQAVEPITEVDQADQPELVELERDGEVPADRHDSVERAYNA